MLNKSVHTSQTILYLLLLSFSCRQIITGTIIEAIKANNEPYWFSIRLLAQRKCSTHLAFLAIKFTMLRNDDCRSAVYNLKYIL